MKEQITYHNKALLISDDKIIPEECFNQRQFYNNIGFYISIQKYLLAKSIIKKDRKLTYSKTISICNAFDNLCILNLN
jgi:hypothetical protein